MKGFDLHGFLKSNDLSERTISTCMMLGDLHRRQGHPAQGLNRLAATADEVNNLVRTGRYIDLFQTEVRAIMGGGVMEISSVFRGPRYNRAIGGARESRHLHYRPSRPSMRLGAFDVLRPRWMDHGLFRLVISDCVEIVDTSVPSPFDEVLFYEWGVHLGWRWAQP